MAVCTVQRQLFVSLARRPTPSLSVHHHHHPRLRLFDPSTRPLRAATILQRARAFSTTSHRSEEHPPTNQPPHAQSPPPPPPPPPATQQHVSSPSRPPPDSRRRRRSRWVSALAFILFGVVIGSAARAAIHPPPPLLPGSAADEALKADIHARALKLPLVQKLMADPEWSHHAAYTPIPPAGITRRITNGPLGSASSIGAYQHIFQHRSTLPSPSPSPPFSPSSSSSTALPSVADPRTPTAEAVSPPAIPPSSASTPTEPVLNVIYFGTATSGWPGVVHGGLLATILDEHAARGALADPSLRNARTGILTASLALRYKKPTLMGNFYLVRAAPVPEAQLPAADRGKRERKIWVDVALETLGGQELVAGRALFVIPRTQQLKEIAEKF